MKTRAAVGFTVKSGWASAVLVAGPASSPRVVDARRIELSDPDVPESRQPYHEGFGTARGAGGKLKRLVASVETFGRRSVRELIREYQKAGHDVQRAGIVVGSLVDPATIGNDHIRIHALEGQLFRTVVTKAAERSRVRCAIWRERDLYASGAAILSQPESKVRGTVTELGRAVQGSWRAEHKTAALAAWLALTGRSAQPARVRSAKSSS